MGDKELERILQRKLRKLSERVERPKPVKKIEILSSENFDLATNGEGPMLVDFWAEWCAPCRYMQPVFEKLSEKYSGRMRFGRLNVDENGDIAARYQVFSIPTFIVFEEGRVADLVVGAVGERGLENLILKHMSSFED